MAKKRTLTKGHWTKEDITYLRKHFGSNATADVAAGLNRGVEAVKKKASRMGLYKTKAYMRKLGRSR